MMLWGFKRSLPILFQEFVAPFGLDETHNSEPVTFLLYTVTEILISYLATDSCGFYPEF